MLARNDAAFALLCQLIETPEAEIHPDAARYSDQREAYEHLLHLSALAFGDGIATPILCPWCGGQDLSSVCFHGDGYRGYCLDCGWIDLQAHQVKSMRVDLHRIVRWLCAALGVLPRYQPEMLAPGYLWRLGEIEHRHRRRRLFFGRRLADTEGMSALHGQLHGVCAPGTGVIMTAASPDTPPPLTGHLVVPLRAVAHLRKAGFVIENLDAYLDGTAASRQQSLETSLRLMHSGRIALIEGAQCQLSPQVYRFLCVLEATDGEPVHKRTLADKLEIDVDKCKGVDICKRHKAVYRTFVGHDSAGHYWLKPEFVGTGKRR